MTEMKYIKNLLSTSTGTEGSLLIVKQIYDTLIDEVEKVLLPRSEAGLYFGPGQIQGSSIDVDLATGGISVKVVAEGADIPIDNESYTSTNLKPTKYGVAIRITKEMLEDGKWNLLQHNIATTGKRFAENETNLILTQLQGCTNNVGGGAAITISDITTGMQYLEDADYTPTTLIVGNEVVNDLRNIDTFAEADKSGSTEMLQRGFIGRIYGMNVIRFSTNAAPSTTYAKYAYVIDNRYAYMIAEKRPVTVENFDLPANDMSAASVTQRIVVARMRDTATCRISTS